MKKFQTKVKLSGHIIDSLTLPKTLDEILEHGCNYEIEEIKVGKNRSDTSSALIRISSDSQKALDSTLHRILKLGASQIEEKEAALRTTTSDGVFPDDFYITTNLPTRVMIKGKWLTVKNICMDSGIKITGDFRHALCIKMGDVKKGDMIVTGHNGIHLTPMSRMRHSGIFEFMGSTVSPEKSKWLAIKHIAEDLKEVRSTKNGKILFVCGPAIIHTGARGYLESLILNGYVDLIFAGNGFATHDIEACLYGTSLGISLKEGAITKKGHEHHLRAINTIRKTGGIRQTVKKGIIKEGIMHACVKTNTDFILTGSIRDDGPLPEVVSDMKEAQRLLREKFKDVKLCIMIASMLHSIAAGNLLPASVKTICVDINPEVVTKLSDRGTCQAVGLVTDAELFLRELTNHLIKKAD